MNIAAYCRVSTDKADQLNSLEAQKEFFSEYTKRTGNTLVRLYADEGISETKIKNRKEFFRMMSDAEHGLFDIVVVKDISRFARNTVDLLQNVHKLKSLEIEPRFLMKYILEKSSMLFSILAVSDTTRPLQYVFIFPFFLLQGLSVLLLVPSCVHYRHRV